jgi:hypothetical protein
MESSRRYRGEQTLLVSFIYSLETNSHIRIDWSSEGLDAVLLIKLLDVIPSRICFKQHHPNCDFAGRIVSVGRVIGESVFAASLIKISDEVFVCANTPFQSFKDSEIDVLVELKSLEKIICLRIMHFGSCSYHHDR